MEAAVTDAKRRLMELLKVGGPMPATALASELDLTDVAIRQHLQALETLGLVESAPLPAKGRGRPSAAWSLTAESASFFPDHHAELVVGLVDAIRGASGDEGLQRVIDARAEEQKAQYRKLLPSSGSLKKRVEALAAQRSEEGYMAEVIQEKPGTYLLIEHHCPICEAASSCLGFCQAELDVFQSALGDGVSVERTKHLLGEDDRCVYRVSSFEA